LTELVKWAFNHYENTASTALTQYTKTTNLVHRTLVEESLKDLDIMPHLMGALTQQICAWVLCAVGLDQFVGKQTVRQMLTRVATEGGLLDIPYPVQDEILNNTHDILNNRYQVGNEAGGPGLVSLDNDQQRLITARLLQIPLSIPYANKPGEQSIHEVVSTVAVNLIPYIVASETMNGIFSINFTPGFLTRLSMWKAGEIRFGADLLASMDLIKKHDEALRKDRNGVLAEFLRKNSGTMMKLITQFFSLRVPSSNLASNIIIVSRDSFEKAETETSMRFNNPNDRKKFFGNTFSLMLVVVDPNYTNVSIFYNGINSIGQYNFSTIEKVGAKAKDTSFNLKDMLNAFNRGNSPII